MTQPFLPRYLTTLLTRYHAKYLYRTCMHIVWCRDVYFGALRATKLSLMLNNNCKENCWESFLRNYQSWHLSPLARINDYLSKCFFFATFFLYSLSLFPGKSIKIANHVEHMVRACIQKHWMKSYVCRNCSISRSVVTQVNCVKFLGHNSAY